MKKEKKGEGNVLMMLILLGMVIFIGLALINPVVNTSNLMSEKQIITNESSSLTNCYAGSVGGGQVNISYASCNLTVTNAPSSWQTTDSQCYLSSVVVTNGTGTILTNATDYNAFLSSGIIQFLNTTATNRAAIGTTNATLTSYHFCNLGYAQDSGSRSISKFWSTMMIIVLLTTAIGVAWGLMNKKD